MIGFSSISLLVVVVAGVHTREVNARPQIRSTAARGLGLGLELGLGFSLGPGVGSSAALGLGGPGLGGTFDSPSTLSPAMGRNAAAIKS